MDKRDNQKAKQVSFKLVLLGESAVGKTRNQFFEYQEATIGAAFMLRVLNIRDGLSVKFEIWDTAGKFGSNINFYISNFFNLILINDTGQERYRSLAPMYYKGAAAAIVVYDITNMESFEKAKGWVNELQRQCESDIVICFAGNKTDLEEERKVNRNKAQAYAEDNNLIFAETSAKTGRGVKDMFLRISERLPIEERLKDQEEKNRFQIYDTNDDDNGPCGC